MKKPRKQKRLAKKWIRNNCNDYIIKNMRLKRMHKDGSVTVSGFYSCKRYSHFYIWCIDFDSIFK